MLKIGKLGSMNELKNWNNIEYEKVRRTETIYDETENYIREKLNSLVDEYSSLGSLQEKRLCRDLIDYSLRRFHQYSVQQRFKAFYFESPQPDRIVFEHIIPASTLRDLLLDKQIDVHHALYPPIANISRNNDQKLREAGLVSINGNLYYPFKRYVTSGIFASSKIVDCFDNEIDPNSFTLSDHYNYINRIKRAIEMNAPQFVIDNQHESLDSLKKINSPL